MKISSLNLNLRLYLISKVCILLVKVQEKSLVQKVPKANEAFNVEAMNIRERCLGNARYFEALCSVRISLNLKRSKRLCKAPKHEIFLHEKIEKNGDMNKRHITHLNEPVSSGHIGYRRLH